MPFPKMQRNLSELVYILERINIASKRKEDILLVSFFNQWIIFFLFRYDIIPQNVNKLLAWMQNPFRCYD